MSASKDKKKRESTLVQIQKGIEFSKRALEKRVTGFNEGMRVVHHTYGAGKLIMAEDKKVQDDYDYSRETYYDLIEKGRESLDLMIEVARESEHPRAFEVLSNMIKGISDVNDKLMDLNKKRKDINKEEFQQIEHQTNNLFVGTTTDLQRLLQKEKETKIIDAEPESKE